MKHLMRLLTMVLSLWSVQFLGYEPQFLEGPERTHNPDKRNIEVLLYIDAGGGMVVPGTLNNDNDLRKQVRDGLTKVIKAECEERNIGNLHLQSEFYNTDNSGGEICEYLENKFIIKERWKSKFLPDGLQKENVGYLLLNEFIVKKSKDLARGCPLCC